MINLTLVVLLLNSMTFLYNKNTSIGCGLLGFSGPVDKKCNIDKIKMLFMLNQERGKDSYGYYSPDSGIVKNVGKVEDYLTKKDSNIPESSMFIGHLRLSSVGHVNVSNAHPFHYGNIVLAMNGTLSNYVNLMHDYGFLWKDFDVDSQVLTAMLNKDQSKSSLSKILGGCAIIYTNTETNTLYCYRNSDRPLYRGNIDDCMYISSLSNSLSIIGCSDVKEFKEDSLYEIRDGKIIGTYKVKRAVPEAEKVIVTKIADIVNTKPFRYIDYDNVKSEDLIGEYLIPKRYLKLGNGAVFLEGYAYKVVGSSIMNIYEIYVEDNFNEVKAVSKHLFKSQIPIINKGDYVFALKRVLHNNKDKSVFCNIGDLMTVRFIRKGKYICTNSCNDHVESLSKDSIRFALEDEVSEYMVMYPVNDYTYEHNNYLGTEDYMNHYPTFGEEKPLVSNIPITTKKTEEETYREELMNTTMETFEDLSQFTIDSLQEQITYIQELAKSVEVNTKINIMNILISNYTEKASILVK